VHGPRNSQPDVQVLRISAASFGFVYGGVKLGYLKVRHAVKACWALQNTSGRLAPTKSTGRVDVLLAWLLQTKAASAAKKQQASGDHH